MSAAVARQEYNRLAVELAKAEFVGGAAERALDTPPFDIGEAVDAVKPAPADNADDPARHGALPLLLFNKLILDPLRLLRRRCRLPRNDRLSLCHPEESEPAVLGFA